MYQSAARGTRLENRAYRKKNANDAGRTPKNLRNVMASAPQEVTMMVSFKSRVKRATSRC